MLTIWTGNAPTNADDVCYNSNKAHVGLLVETHAINKLHHLTCIQLAPTTL